MPGGDGTGPGGMGPMTGRAAGFCAGNATPGFSGPIGGGRGFGRGRGRGGGWGWRNRFHATGLYGWQRAAAVPPQAGDDPWARPDREQSVAELRSQADRFEAAIGAIRKRIDQLEAED